MPLPDLPRHSTTDERRLLSERHGDHDRQLRSFEAREALFSFVDNPAHDALYGSTRMAMLHGPLFGR
ncbi:hypothetical protein [Candidatus Halobonum tyrrellensis]|uniref:hypothetical protein n=1 Tax=Candidatus Halobonum tyrrellensis TaxID=1431545 RepID=UPI000677B4BE|nr:hypothetical protein [Candidatus Halobonum tyrrellensis]